MSFAALLFAHTPLDLGNQHSRFQRLAAQRYCSYDFRPLFMRVAGRSDERCTTLDQLTGYRLSRLRAELDIKDGNLADGLQE